MKTNRIFLVMLSASMAIISCKGDKGDLGPQGPQGTQGQTGTAGQNGQNGQNGQTTLTKTTTLAVGSTECPHGGTKIEVGLDANNNGVLDAAEVIAAQTKVVCNGAPGTANVQYSNWMRVTDANWEKISEGPSSNWDTIVQYKTEIPTPAVTQEILDRGIVLYYMKDATPLGMGAVKNFDPTFVANDNQWGGYRVGVTNRTLAQQGGNWNDSTVYADYWVSTKSDTISKQKLTLNTSWRGSRGFWDPSHGLRMYAKYKQKYHELAPKTDFYIRYVIIPGGNPTGGKMNGAALPVDRNNYEAVKKYYGIKD